MGVLKQNCVWDYNGFLNDSEYASYITNSSKYKQIHSLSLKRSFISF